MSAPSRAIFLSYASEDAEAAQRICQALTAAGVEVWFDQSELRCGDAWDQQIRRQIRDCALFMPVMSVTTAARSEGYFRLEWALADERCRMIARNKAFIVPVCLDRTLESGADVPDSFQRVQWTRLPGGTPTTEFVFRISTLLGNVLPAAPEPVAGTSEPASVPTQRKLPNRGPQREVLLGGLLLVVAAGWLAWWLSTSRHSREAAGQSPPSVTAVEHSIAVLPFIDLSEKRDQEYFADGMAEEILNLLVKVPDLKVIGRTSSFQFKGKADDLRKIGMALGVTYVVAGSVRRSGDHVRVTAQLIDTRDGSHRWSETYDRDVKDALKVQDEIAANLVRALQLEMAPAVYSQRRTPGSSEAYDLSLRGLHALDRLDEAGFDEALAHYRHALEVDPSYVAAAEGVAWALYQLADHLYVPAQAGFEQARAAAVATLRLEPNSPTAHAVLALIHIEYDFDWNGAGREVDAALALAPHDPTVVVCVAEYKIAVGQWTDAVRITDAAIAADPLNANLYRLRSYAYLRLGRAAAAETGFRRALEISPTYAWEHYFLGMALLSGGRPDEALMEMQREVVPEGADTGAVVAYEALRRPQDAEAALARLLADVATPWPFGLAVAYTAVGRKDDAFQWLDKAYVARDASLWAIKGHPFLKSLEPDLRYKAFLRKMGLAE